jgi:FMN phosphatase YigB (HAD superfamily)
VPAGDALFIDDVELNCQVARELGMEAVWFRSSDQAIAEAEAQLSSPSRSQQ